jgi:hypothetical protein
MIMMIFCYQRRYIITNMVITTLLLHDYNTYYNDNNDNDNPYKAID